MFATVLEEVAEYLDKQSYMNVYEYIYECVWTYLWMYVNIYMNVYDIYVVTSADYVRSWLCYVQTIINK